MFLVYLLTSKLLFVAGFKVERNYQDSFQNPDCLAHSKCSYKSCLPYNGNCNVRGCKSCSCGGSSETFSFIEGNATGRCMEQISMVNFPGSKEQMFIRVDVTTSNQCLYVAYDSSLDIHDGCWKNDDRYHWIYTKDKQLINLKKFDCLTLSSDNKVTVRPCSTIGKNQQWYCDTNGALHSKAGDGSPKYLFTNGFRLTTTGLQKWKRYDPTQGSDLGNICDNPVQYKGCYRLDLPSSNNFMGNINLSQKPSKVKDATTFKVFAPIFVENNKCYINWEDSKYLKDSNPWKTVEKPDNSITVSNADGRSRGIQLKVSSSARGKWSGTVLKLQVKCSSWAASEQHCVLLKFFSGSSQGGKDDDDDGDDNDTDDDENNKDDKDNDKDGIFITYNKPKSKTNSYKISTIVLAACLAIVLIGIVVYFGVRRKMYSRRSVNDSIPFYNENLRA